MTTDLYQNPLITRYASPEMSAVFAPRHRASIWRELWIALAEAERELGLDVSQEAIDSMRAHIDEIDLVNQQPLALQLLIQEHRGDGKQDGD